jgi:hypothetical protein
MHTNGLRSVGFKSFAAPSSRVYGTIKIAVRTELHLKKIRRVLRLLGIPQHQISIRSQLPMKLTEE